MRFIQGGPDIPQELISAQERGQVIFVCGAGVSMTLNLPDFRGLVLKIYELLGEDPTLHLAEREAVSNEGLLKGQYDRVLRLLERRLAASNIGRDQGMRERVRDALRTALVLPEDPDLSNHRALIDLSRDSEGALRLVTTNFDTLFERAWPGELGSCPSYAGPAMPQPKTAGFTGILHLHGRLADVDLALSETELVLTSAEFGDAYLRSGWASRYVYDLVRAYTVVLVGYGADDPPMRYLLEVLEADRERYPDLQKVYAFADCDDANAALRAALWRAKGVEPIMHQLHEGSYSPLYDSIREWARYAENASKWRCEQLEPLLALSPSDLRPDQVSRVVQLLAHGDASEQLRRLSPAAAWIPFFQDHGIIAGDISTIGPWIAAKIDDAAMISACSGLGRFDDRTRFYIERAIDDNLELSPHRRKAWELLLLSKRGRPDWDLSTSWARLAPRVGRGEAGYVARRLIASMFRPRIKIRKPWKWSEIEEERPETLHSLIWLEYEAKIQVTAEEILNKWPRDIISNRNLLLTLGKTLEDALDEAADAGFMDGYDRAERDVPSIAPHSQNAHRSGFCPLTRLTADVWLRLAELEPAFALSMARTWIGASSTLMRRLGLFAAAHPCIPAAEASEWILNLNDYDFWISGGQVEIMKALVDRWDEFPLDHRELIQARIIGGIPRALFPDSDADDDQWASIDDSGSYRRLTRLRDADRELSAGALNRIADIQSRNPEWKSGPGDRDDFHTWSESGWGPSGKASLLENIPDDQLVAEALRIQQERMWDQSDLWRVFCQADPEKALRGLSSQAQRGVWNAEAWRPLIWTAAGETEAGLLGRVADQIIAMPDEALRPLLDSAANLAQSRREALQSPELLGGPRYFAFWDRIAALAYDGAEIGAEADDADDLSTRALNRAGGILVWTLVEAVSALELEGGSGIPDEYKRRFNLAINDRSVSGQYARVQTMQHLAYLEHIDPTWVGEKLVPMLAWGEREARILWRANAYDRIGSPRLFNALRADLLVAASQPRLENFEAEVLAGRIFQVALWHQNGQALEYQSDVRDLRRVLVVGCNEVRRTIAWQLWRLMGAEASPAERGRRWIDSIGPLFRAIWPLDAHLRSESLSENLMRMALEAGDAFPDAVDAVVDLVVPVRLWEISLSLRLEARHADIDRAYPRPFLRLLNALVDPAQHPPPADLAAVLDRCSQSDAGVVQEASYRRLFGIAQARGA